VRVVVVVVTSSANATAEKSATPAAPIAILLKILIVTSDLAGSWPCANNPKCGRRFRAKKLYERELRVPKISVFGRKRITRRALNPTLTLRECAAQIKL
jgi:hypothetical protein